MRDSLWIRTLRTEVRRICDARDRAAQIAATTTNLKEAVRLAHFFHRIYPPADYEELRSVAYMGLLEAAYDWKTRIGRMPMMPYLRRGIRRALGQYIRESSPERHTRMGEPFTVPNCSDASAYPADGHYVGYDLEISDLCSAVIRQTKPGRQRRVVTWRCLSDLSVAEVATGERISSPRVSQIYTEWIDDIDKGRDGNSFFP